jgi:predicted DNA-binding transcriptional regulator AlpA
MPKQIWITAKEAAALCNVTAKTFYRWRKNGDSPPATKFSNKKIWYDEQDVLTWIAGKRE